LYKDNIEIHRGNGAEFGAMFRKIGPDEGLALVLRTLREEAR
jgi:hypothetical protein